MEPEGMVHALEEIPRLLRPDGILIDIHPVPESPRVKVLRGEEVVFNEPRRPGDHEDIQQADQALADVVGREMYVVERKEEFDFLSYGSTSTELREFWDKYNEYDDTPKEAARIAHEDAVYSGADKIMQEAGVETKIAIHELVKIARLNPQGGYR